MPLLYGEGHRAFKRLQEEIITQSGDDSILAWGLDTKIRRLSSVWELSSSEAYRVPDFLAESPLAFANCGPLRRSPLHPV